MVKCSINVLLILGLMSFSQGAMSQCLSLAKGPIMFDVASCKSVVPKDDFNKTADYTFYKGMTSADKANFMKQYQGVILHGLVVKSEAVQVGFDTKKGALAGNKIKIFIPGNAFSCQSAEKIRLAAPIEEICCNGSANAPCLLGTSYVFKSAPQIVGAAGTESGDKERTVAVNDPDFQKAAKLLKEKKYQEAARLLEQVRSGGKLDVRGHFLLGQTYRNLDECKKAIPVLDEVFNRAARKDVWADQEDIVRKSNFLLARCYSRTSQPDRATIILDAYLIEPKKFRAEIQQSLKHPDFGYINASKQYRQYTERARAALR